MDEFFANFCGKFLEESVEEFLKETWEKSLKVIKDKFQVVILKKNSK